VVLQVIDGLEAAYQRGIIHQDIKPANILLTRDENAKVADLGLAVVIDRRRLVRRGTDRAAPAMAGTVAYLAPEQVGGRGTIDHRADIYSLGATFYHMVTGQLPFQGKTPLVVIMKHVNEPVRPPCDVVREFDRGLSDVIVKMLAKHPDERFRTYDELREALIDADIAMNASAANLWNV
jgi:serine/threonine protein kinase